MSRPRYKIDENYVAFSDIMTCLMIIFLFVALSYIMDVYSGRYVQEDLYNSISAHLSKELQNSNVRLSKDLSLKFINAGGNDSSEVLFEQGDDKMTHLFTRQIDSIWPKYQKIILADSFINHIGEIRIEGHADTTSPRKSKMSSYDYNLELSSKRAQKVLHYIRNMECYKVLPIEKKERLQYLLTANGMSYSRSLNKDDSVAYLARNKQIELIRSRRVEFKIVTTNQVLIKKLEE
jgi:flagellar motor protein MotB